MIKQIVFIATLVAVVSAAPAEKDPIPILNQESEVDYNGKFHFSYESGDGSKVQQDGELKTIDKENAGEAVQGFYEYKGEDGKTYKVSYTADENGYVPQGEHIPQTPPLIQRALAYLATAPPPKDSKY
ncbi:hypothetical protein Zmor_013673 [Zophobas morio]|uniref:Uncharacterized protein n=2 Tax=Zophobas morio TaxID=2755281 RepID=A0AA38MFY3_9CUCU|nr:hypothetical protein Zmor_013673 [Zophobas morio]